MNILSVPHAFAYDANAVDVSGLGFQTGFLQVLGNIVDALVKLAIPTATAIFIAGAVMLVAFSYKEERAKTGKDLMIGSLIGLGVIYSAYGILQLFLSLIYGG